MALVNCNQLLYNNSCS